MRSSMAEMPLSLVNILTNAQAVHGTTSVTTYSGGYVDHATFDTIALRANALAFALRDTLTIGSGTRVGTVMGNSSEHMEIFLASSCMGGIFHPINARMDSDQLGFIIEHAQDEVLFIDTEILPDLISLLLDQRAQGAFTRLTDLVIVSRTTIDRTVLETRMSLLESAFTLHHYEDLLNNRETQYPWPVLSENTAAALCYTPATQGVPKGVTYSHRSLWLHSLTLASPNEFNMAQGKSFLCITSLAHSLGWGVPLTALMMGTPLIFHADIDQGVRIAHIIQEEHPDQACGTPDIWLDVYRYAQEDTSAQDFVENLPEEIFTGGAAITPALRRVWKETFHSDLIQIWGMTETSAIGTVNRESLESEQSRYSSGISSSTIQGYFPAGIEYRVVDGWGEIIEDPQLQAGELQVRGNWVARRYYTPLPQSRPLMYRGVEVNAQNCHFTDDGWLATGDVVTISPQGALTIQDRMGDMIQAGDELVFSSQLEQTMISLPSIQDTAIIGISDDDWGQRPLAIVELVDGYEPTAETAQNIIDELQLLATDWMVPRHWSFVPQILRTATGNKDKVALRSLLDEGKLEVIELK